MATLLTESFSNNANGPPGNADSGQAWVLTGAPELGVLTVNSGVLELSAGGINGYAQVVLDGVPDTLSATFSLSAAGAVACLLSHREAVFHGYRLGLHIVITLNNIDVQVRDSATTDGGPFVSVIPGGPHTFASPLTPGVTLGLIVNVFGSTALVTAPDGVVLNCTDARIAALMGHKLVVQGQRTLPIDGTVRWATVNASGPLGQPVELPDPPAPGDGGTTDPPDPTGPVVYPAGCEPWPARFPCDVSDLDADLVAEAVAVASDLVAAISGQQFGLCTQTLRPCRRDCADDYTWNRWVASNAYGDVPFVQPALVGGQWYNLPCGQCYSGCSCSNVSEILLPAPVHDVLQVTVGGSPLVTGAYRLDDSRLLVRTDGGEWPRCNDLSVGPYDDGAWTVTARFGRAVPEGGAWAVGALACEVLKEFAGESCRLPKNVTQLVRQGVTIDLPSARQLLENNLTGVYLTDMFVQTWNPNRLKQRSRTYSVDRPRARRVT